MLRGIFAPIPTPFSADGEIDYESMSANLNIWSETKLSGVVVLGSNGEFVYLSPQEKAELVRFVRQNFPEGRPVIAGTGCESTRATIEMTARAADAGCDAALVLTPHYFKGSMSPDVLKRFFFDVADQSEIPVMLYNMPGNSGINMTSSLVAEISEHPNVVGIKDSGGNIVQISETITRTGDDFAVFAGSGSFLLPALVMGAAGGTLAVANIMADTCAGVMDAFEAGDMDRAVQLQRRLLAPNAAVTARFGIPGLKAAMDMLGYFGGPPRRPMLPVSDDVRAQLRTVLSDAGLDLTS
ncbi:MAG: dihydrodipicolinate synthase family protein [Clostridia bacterium]